MIKIQGLCKAFDGQPVLVNWDFSLQKGEHLALMGPSGCGKTTFLRILMGLEQPDSGLIQGVDGLRLAPVFQQDRLCPGLSALANLLLVCPRPTARDRRRALELLEGLGLTETDWNKPAAQLSGGQRRRAALARALLVPADLVLLDEAFKGLDQDTRRQALALTAAETEGRSLLAVTHDPDEAALLAARVVQMPRAARPDNQP